METFLNRLKEWQGYICNRWRLSKQILTKRNKKITMRNKKITKRQRRAYFELAQTVFRGCY